jgi:putative nucleotidyltransferase with HDIG domain
VTVPGWSYRAKQLQKALRERRQPVPHEFVRAHLDVGGQALFYAMSPRDQAHSSNTAILIGGSSNADPELTVAALLHDAGKGKQIIWQRVLYVVAGAVAPRWLACWARPGPDTRGALYRSLYHTRLGAQLAAASGLSDRVCRLIAEHHNRTAEPDLRLLQWADEVA